MTETKTGHPKFTHYQCVKDKPESCEKCPLYATSPKVPAEEINPAERTKILVVGESPAISELHKPYQGATGNFIRRLFQDLGLYDYCVFTNTTQCRAYHYEEGSDYAKQDPPGQREVNACRRFLLGTIRQHKPVVIVALGDTAWSALKPTSLDATYTITRAQGRAYQSTIEGRRYTIVPVTNPAAILKTGNLYDYIATLQLMESVGRLVDPSRALTQSTVRQQRTVPNHFFVRPPWLADDYAAGFDFESVSLPPTISTVELSAIIERFPDQWKQPEILEWDEFIQDLESHHSPCVAMDIEARGLDPFDVNADVLCLSVSINGRVAYIFPVAAMDVMLDPSDRRFAYDALFQVLDHVYKYGTPIWHNAAYDHNYISTLHQRVYGETWEHADTRPRCTLLMHHLTHTRCPHKLEDATWWLGFDQSHKGLMDEYRKLQSVAERRDWGNNAWWILAPYCAMDAAVTKVLYDVLCEHMNQHPHLLKLWDSVHDIAGSAYRMMRDGIAPDMEANAAAEGMIEPLVRHAKEQIFFNPLVQAAFISKWGFPAQTPYTFDNVDAFFNPNSNPQLSLLMFGVNGWDAEKGKIDNPLYGIGADRSLASETTQGYSTSEGVMSALIGTDDEWAIAKAESGIARQVPRTDGKEGMEWSLEADDYHKYLNEKILSGMQPARALKMIRPYAIKSVAEAITEARHWRKMLSTYVESIRSKHVKSDGLMHPEWLVQGTITGRWSSFFHTFPRAVNPALIAVKKQLKSRFQDGLIVGSDQAQVEARVAGILSRDQAMLTIFHERRDLHTEVAAKFFACAISEVTKPRRQLIKIVHFSTIYRVSADTLAAMLVSETGMDAEEALSFAERFIDWYWTTFPDLYSWREYMFDTLRKDDACHVSLAQQDAGVFNLNPLKGDPLNYKAVTPFGRELSFPRGTKYTELQRHTCNYPIQSTAGDITNHALVNIERGLREQKMRSKVIMSIHDALYVDTHPAELESVKRLMAVSMLDTGSYKGWIEGCPLATNLQVGPSWGALKEDPAINTDQLKQMGWL